MKNQIVLGTKNRGKQRELKALLKGMRVEVLSLADFLRCPEAIENGRTFEANAKKKARLYSKYTQLLTLADDSGLMVDVLKGKPGVYSARFAGKNCSYQDNNRKLLGLLKNFPPSKRKAKFVSVVALYDSGKLIKVVRGECLGKIAFAEQGMNGFGYDPVFIPDGFSKTFAQISPRIKNKISHRGKALRKAKKVITQWLGAGSRSFCR